MNKPITLCDRCDEVARCLLDYDGIPCRRNRTVEPTHADRIRAKSDEELAEWIETIVSCSLCPLKEKNCKGGRVESRASCKRHWLDWLRQEATT